MSLDNKPAKLFIWFLLIIFSLSSCTSYRVVNLKDGSPESHSPTRGLVIGDYVKIKTNQGEVLNFRVQHIDPDTLFGAEAKVAFNDIETLEKSKTGAASVSGTMIVAFLVLVAVIAITQEGSLFSIGPAGGSWGK